MAVKKNLSSDNNQKQRAEKEQEEIIEIKQNPEEAMEEKDEKNSINNEPLAETISLDTSSIQQAEKKGGKIILFIGLILIGAAISIGVFIAYRKTQVQKQIPNVEPVPTKSQTLPSPTPTTTPTPTLDRSELSLKVLNGTGEPGVAGAAAEMLEEKGYENVDTGNADSYDYQETVILIKENKSEYFDLLYQDLSEEYSVSSEAASLDEDSDYDAEIIIGS